MGRKKAILPEKVSNNKVTPPQPQTPGEKIPKKKLKKKMGGVKKKKPTHRES